MTTCIGTYRVTAFIYSAQCAENKFALLCFVYSEGRQWSVWLSPIENSSVEVYQHDYWTEHDQIYGELTHEFMHFAVDGNNLLIQAIRDNGSLIQEFNITK